MPKDPSFDIVSVVDMQVMDDCVNVAVKEISNRFDFKGQNITIELNKGEKTVTITAPAEFVLNQVKDILFQKFIKRGLNQKSLREKKKEKDSNISYDDALKVSYNSKYEKKETKVGDYKYSLFFNNRV